MGSLLGPWSSREKWVVVIGVPWYVRCVQSKDGGGEFSVQLAFKWALERHRVLYPQAPCQLHEQYSSTSPEEAWFITGSQV